MKTILHEILNNSRLAPITKQKYNLILDRWIDFTDGKPENWTRKNTQAFYKEILKTVSATSANVYINCLRYVSKWYAHMENKPELEFAIIQTQESTQAEPRQSFTQEEILLLVNTCKNLTFKDRRDLVLIIISLETGMRRISLSGFNIENISTTLYDYPIAKVPIKGKGGNKTFEVPLSDTCVKILNHWINYLGVTTGPVFPRSKQNIKKPISPTMINKIIESRGKKAGIRHIHPHLFRHTFVTWRAQDGLDVNAIASITGHTVPGMGGIKHYVDYKVIAERARASTPSWLAILVNELVQTNYK